MQRISLNKEGQLRNIIILPLMIVSLSDNIIGAFVRVVHAHLACGYLQVKLFTKRPELFSHVKKISGIFSKELLKHFRRREI